MIRALQLGVELWFADNPEAKVEFAALEGHTVVVELTDLGLSLLLRPGTDGLRVEHAGTGGEADAVISGRSFDLLRLSRESGARGAGGKVDIRGDAELGQKFRDVLREVRPDPEERLARLVGDVPAHEIGRLLRGLAAFGQDVLQRSGDMLAEYLHHESRDLPTRTEVDEFITGVDEVRDAVERAEARFRRILDSR